MGYKYLNKWVEEKQLRYLGSKFRLLCIDNDSLTKRLQNLSKKEFNINIIDQKNFYLSDNNFFDFSNIFKGYVIYRKVILNSDQFGAIHAESFFPIKYLNGKEKRLKMLGNKSLGTYILRPNKFKRLRTDFKIIDNHICRSIIYRYRKKYVLVREYFPTTLSSNTLTLLKCRRQV